MLVRVRLHLVIVVVKLDVFWPQPVVPDEFSIPRWPLVFGIAGQHALQAHAYALDVLNRTPASGTEQVQTDDAVGVDVRVDRNRPIRQMDEYDLRRFCMFSW